MVRFMLSLSLSLSLFLSLPLGLYINETVGVIGVWKIPTVATMRAAVKSVFVVSQKSYFFVFECARRVYRIVGWHDVG